MKKLTIVIPTYNRCKYVRENIENTLPQIIIHKEDVEMFIVDNASTDGTNEMIKNYIEKYPDCLRYHKHKINIGSNLNFDYGITHSNSEYVYLLGDDDLVSTNFITSILELINTNQEIYLFHFNYLICGNKMEYVKLHLNNNISNSLITKYKKGKDFIKQFHSSPSFMSSNVFKREVWIKGERFKKDDCPGYNWLLQMYSGIIDMPCAFYFIPLAIQRDSGVCGYKKNWSYYSLISISRMFEYLNEQCDGLYENWMNYRKKQRFNILLEVCATCEDRKRYKTLISELKHYMPNKRYTIFLYLNLYILPTFFIKKVECNIIIIYKKIDLYINQYKYMHQ